MQALQGELTSSARDLRRDVVAAVDRQERTFSALEARLEVAESSHKEQYEFILTQLKRAQDERQEAQQVNREDNRNEIVRSRGLTDDNRQKATQGLKAIWDMGGKWIVYAIAAWFAAKLLGVPIDLTRLLGP